MNMAKDKFDRGTALTIFKNDRTEDMAALVIALIIVAVVAALTLVIGGTAYAAADQAGKE